MDTIKVKTQSELANDISEVYEQGTISKETYLEVLRQIFGDEGLVEEYIIRREGAEG